MLEILGHLFGDLILYGLLWGTGHIAVYAISLGQARCTDELAIGIGLAIWLIILIIVLVISVR